MRFLVLGPLEVTGQDGSPLSIPGSKERLVLALLVSRAGQVIPVDELVETLWGATPPRTADRTLGVYVSRLRRAFQQGLASGAPNELISSRAHGYVLDARGHEVDASSFENRSSEGRRFLDEERTAEARVALEDALSLWRGQAYQEFRDSGFGSAEGERLDELRRSATEDLVDARLAEGDGQRLIAELEAMVKAEPFRERRWGQLMLALYRGGRQAEALAAFNRAREVLVDELGVEPGPDLQRIQAAILTHDAELDLGRRQLRSVSATDVCPYKGLVRFEASDADFFFGREVLVSEAIARLIGDRFLAFVGASGSGKSSLMRAGLLHALGSGAIPGSERWHLAVMQPGEHPLDRFDHAKASVEQPGRWVIAIDQFEEVFTAGSDEAERVDFFDSLTNAALDPDGHVTIVLAMRADYYGRCADHRVLASLLEANQILVGAMDAQELARAVERPAQRAGLTVGEGLTAALVDDCTGQAGALPLLSTALLELWTQRQDRTLRLDDYRRSGGLEGAVGRHAEEAYGRLDQVERAAAKRIMLRLADPGDGGDAVRRRAPLAEFDLERDAEASRAMTVLTQARLVTTTGEGVEVAHEALLREWPRLRDWLEEDAQGRRLHRQVTEQARAWDDGARDEADLYRGARLAAALEWSDAHQGDLNDLEHAFLDAGRSVSEGEIARTRRTNRILRSLLAAVAVLLVLSLLVGSLALRQRDASRVAATVADARRLAEDSLHQKDPVVGLLLAREAVALEDSAETRSALLAALQREPAALAVMHAKDAEPGDQTEWLRLSPNGRVIATGGAGPAIDLFDATTYRPIGSVSIGGPSIGGAFSPVDGTLAVATDRRILRVDVTTPGVLDAVSLSTDGVDAIAYAPGGDLLLTAETDDPWERLVPRDPVTLEPRARSIRSGAPIEAMAFSDDGRHLITTAPIDRSGDPGRTDLWSVPELERLRTFAASGNDVALSPDGRTAAIAATYTDSTSVDELEGHLLLLDLQTGSRQLSDEGRTPGLYGPPLGLTGVTYSKDGASIVTTGDDYRILVWDPTSPPTVRTAFEDPGDLAPLTPVLSADGTTAFTIDLDGNVAAWDLSGSRSLGHAFIAGSGAVFPSGANGFPWFAISPDGDTVAIVQYSGKGIRGSVRLVAASTAEQIATIPYYRYNAGFPRALAFSPDGGTLVVTSVDGYVQLFDVRTGTPRGAPLQTQGGDRFTFWTASFSPDGTEVAAGGYDAARRGVLYVWNVATGRVIGRLGKQANFVSSVLFEPDGQRIVASTGWGPQGVGYVVVWNPGEDIVERRIRADDSGVAWADISSDGSILVTGGASARLQLWDLATGRRMGPAIRGETASLDLSSDGRTLVSTGKGIVTMWDTASGVRLGRSFPGPDPGEGAKGEDIAASFTPDGRRLFVVSERGRAWVWNVDQAAWPGLACRIAGRSLTPAEWGRYLPDRPFQSVCPS